MATATGRRYARAVFELAQKDGDVAAWGRRLAELKELLSDRETASALTNPTLDVARRMELVSGLPGIDAEATNLAKLLVESSRVLEIANIEAEYGRLADAAAGRVRATVTTAVELGPRERDRVAEELSRRLGQEVRLDVVVDPRILGGIKLQYGDRLVDASIATKLQQLRRRLAAS